jgi:hypothetical protein
MPRIVTTAFVARESSGSFSRSFAQGEKVVFLHHGGDENELSVFATLEDVLRCDPGKQPQPSYEVERVLFATATVATHI